MERLSKKQKQVLVMAAKGILPVSNLLPTARALERRRYGRIITTGGPCKQGFSINQRGYRKVSRWV
jgi:hypothetical protein